jgi:hypothetical protein
MRPRTAAAAAVVAVGLLTGACSVDATEQPAENMVLNLGGQVVRLDGLDARPEVIGGYPAGGEGIDVYTLTDPRQMPSGEVVGIRDGTAVAIDLDDVEKATVLAPAVDWFPAAAEQRIWAVTEPEDDTACDRGDLPKTARSRVQVAEHDTDGRPARRTLTLPCGVDPIADTAAGIVAERITDEIPGKGNAATAQTAVVLLDDSGRPERVIAESGTVLAAAGHRIVMSTELCAEETCTETGAAVYDTETKERQALPQCAADGFSGQGIIDATGRWYAAAVGAGDGRPSLSVVDLEERSCQDLGSFPGLSEGTDMPDDLSAVWSGAHLVLLDPSSGDVVTHNVLSDETARRKRPVDVTNGGQVWGAAD